MEVRQWLGLGLEGRGWGWGQGWEEQMVGNITTKPVLLESSSSRPGESSLP